MEFTNSLRLVAPEILLSVSGLVLLLVAAWTTDRASRAITSIAVAVLVAASVLVAPALSSGASGPDTAAFFGQFRADAFASFAKLLIYGTAAASLMIAPAFFERHGAMRAEYPVLILFAALGMGMMVSAGDLLTLYIGLELSSLAAYVLAAFLRNDERSAEAGLKYFVLGALASGILLFGMSLTYGFTGTTSFEGIRAALDGEMALGALFGVVFVLAGLAFKISAVPFHMWTPDVYEGAPAPVTTFFATAPKIAAMALTMRVALDAFGPQVDAWRQIIIFAALASIVVGALGAIGQANIKRLMAYSSINNVGFMLIGLAAATVAGASAMLVYLAIYAAMSLGAFVAILMLKREDGEAVEAISDISGLSQTRPALAAALAMIMFSLAGIPPLFGFWGKFVVFQAAVEADLIVLAAIGIAASVIGAFYYIKIVKIMYFDAPADVVKGQSDWAHHALLWLSAIFISPLGYLLTKWLGNLANSAAAALFVAA
ncbi:MAG: NADH-quinone oxidoreductase subunit NuoN [Sphingomonadaceae bacterium]|nr:NADH-quinone oxidoreductase subunit NuoN [Sphingomonadaceae bacterium]